MNLVNQSELKRTIEKDTGESFAQQAISAAIRDGRLKAVLKGRKRLIDLDDKLTKIYIKATNRQREQARKTNEYLKIVNESSEKEDKKDKKKKDASEIDNLDPLEMRRRTQFADMRKRELQVLVMEKKYLPIEFIDSVYIKYLETFNSTVERLASTFINDVGKQILEKGEILPEHIEKFNTLILETISNNKKSVKRLLKNYEPSI